MAALVFSVTSFAEPAEALEVRLLNSYNGVAGFELPSYVEWRVDATFPPTGDPVVSTSELPGATVGTSGWGGVVFAADAAGLGSTQDYKYRLENNNVFRTWAGSGVIYDVTLDVLRRGALVYYDDGTGGARGSLGAMRGSLYQDGVVVMERNIGTGYTRAGDAALAGSVNFPTPDTVPSLAGQWTSFRDEGSFEVAGLQGSHQFRVELIFDLSVMSGDCLTSITQVGPIPTPVPCSGGGDEIAVLLGLAGTQTGVVADNYPGIGNRTQSLDGVFVGITATATSMVPEPGMEALFGAGLLAVFAEIRRRRGCA